jgi:hypothetical protein
LAQLPTISILFHLTLELCQLYPPPFIFIIDILFHSVLGSCWMLILRIQGSGRFLYFYKYANPKIVEIFFTEYLNHSGSFKQNPEIMEFIFHAIMGSWRLK